MLIYTKEFWAGALNRVVRSVIQGFLTVLVVGGVVDLSGADWKAACLLAGGMGLASLLTSLSSPESVVAGAKTKPEDVIKPDVPAQ